MTKHEDTISRRAFLQAAAALSAASIGSRGIYGLLDAVAGPARPVLADAPIQYNEQYRVSGLATLTDNGVTLMVPPLYTDVVTATLAAGRAWDPPALMAAQGRLERALKQVEGPHQPTAAGLTIVVGWGLNFFRSFLPASLWQTFLPVDVALSQQLGTTQYALLDAIPFPSDPADLVLEQNHVVFKLRSDSQMTISTVEQALFKDQNSAAYVGDLFDITSIRRGFVGRGFTTPSVAKTLALAAGVAGADQIPDTAQLMLGFTSTQQAALGPDNVPSFETLPGMTNQSPQSYFAGGCTMHLSHLFEDLQLWYTSFDYTERVARMFSPRMPVSEDESAVTLPNGITEHSSADQVKNDALRYGMLGHNATLQQATRLPHDVTDAYGIVRPAGMPIPLREDFNTLDNPFFMSAHPDVDHWSPTPNTPGLHFIVFVPSSSRFHRARLAMDGILPDGTNLRTAPYNIADAKNGINAAIRTTHRQNYLVPPRTHRAFPLVEQLTTGQTRTSTPTSPTGTATGTPTTTPTVTPVGDRPHHVFLPLVKH